MKDILNSIDGKVTMIQSDNGSEFLAEFDQMLKDKGIKHMFSNPHSPWCNGKVEVFNKHLKTYLYRYFTMNNTKRYIEYLPSLVDSYNNSVNSTGYTPNDIFNNELNFEIRDHIDKRNAKKIVERMNNEVYNVGDNIRISTDVAYQMLPNLYKPPSTFKKTYTVNWTKEIFIVDQVVKNTDFINGYKVSYNGTKYNQLVRPHHIRKIDLTKLIKIEPQFDNLQPEEENNDDVPQVDLPITQMEERRQNLTRTQLRQPVNLDDIFGDERIVF